MSKDWEIRRYRPEDKDAVLSLYARVRGTPMGEREKRLWEWQFERNPFHPPEGLLYWVVDGEEGLIGQMGTMPVKLQLEGQLMPSAWGVDLMVDPVSRRRGLALEMLLTWTQSLEVTLGKGIADVAYRVATRRLSWRDIGPTYRHFKLLNTRRVLAEEFRHPLLGRAGAVAGALIDKALTRRKPGADPRVEMRDPSSLGEEIDTLWSEVGPAYPMAPVRDAAYVKWRYGEHPSHQYRVLLRWEGERLCGFFILRSMEDRKGRKAGLVLDAVTHPEDTETMDTLLAQAIDQFRREGADYVATMLTNRAFHRGLSQQGFIRRRAPETRLIGEFGRLRVQPSRVLSAENWHISLGDADTEIL